MKTSPPIKLDAEARRFWDRHHDRLTKAGLLTDADVDGFAALCVLWSKFVTIARSKPGADRFREMVQLNQLSKQLYQYGREFGLFPAARKRSKLNADAPPAKDEYGL